MDLFSEGRDKRKPLLRNAEEQEGLEGSSGEGKVIAAGWRLIDTLATSAPCRQQLVF